MNFMVYTTRILEDKMMDEWAQVPFDKRPLFRTWCYHKALELLEKEYGVNHGSP